MTLAGTPPTRRSRRAETGALQVGAPEPERPVLTPDPGPAGLGGAAVYGTPGPGAFDPDPAKPAKPGKAPRAPRQAFGWVDERTVAQTALAPRDLSAAATSYITVDADLLARAPRRSPFRAGVLVPILVILAIVGGYSGTTLLWPLHAVAPEIEAIQVDSAPSPVAALTFPAQGSAAVSVAGFGAPVASGQDAVPIASITKLVTALVVLEEMPLAVGEQGPEYRFTASDRTQYRAYRNRGESALDVPVGGTLTEYQLLEGVLISSANNYADRLASGLWPSDAVYASAARSWLEKHGVPGVTVVEPTGIDPRNTASAASLLVLMEKAVANPVIAEILAKPTTDLPGAGTITTTNGMLADAGVIGGKTGTLRADHNLVAAKNVMIGETPVRLYGAVLGQADDAGRVEALRALFAQIEAELQTEPSVPAGTTVGVIDTEWGEHIEVKTASDAAVVLWNGITGTVSTDLSLGDDRDEGDEVGALSVTGPVNASTVDVVLTDEIEPPTPWWRLTHPLELFGLAG